ncbi:membrane-spanning 4-domains subfamily A member 4A-like isoform X3 [Lynx rufus]|uniref:membrane-spanning 4-domains subfamily A member 4A-like isoform X3 n=1 Tax=Lynx rufus TaxID=61384 RepID=UPI001F128AFE|nr:membrane-spanning 4-domains subfamily A member 4A-like isoform X3 [Lynx rufus]
MVLRNDGPEELAPPTSCSSRGMQRNNWMVWPKSSPERQHHPSRQTDNLKIFLKGEPQILGVTQILIGLMKVCLFVIGLCFYSSDFRYWCYPLTMVSGYPVWGSLFIKGSLGVNLLSAVAGVIGIIVLIIELTVLFAPEKKCLILKTFEIVILVLSLLEVSIAISLSVFGCKVTCFVTQVVIIQSTNDKVSSAIAPHEHIYEELEFE